MKRVIANKIASSTKNVPLKRDLRVQDEITAEEGYVVAAKVLHNKAVYDKLEDRSGRFVTLHEGDIIVGVLRKRNALHGYAGVVPQSVAVGDTLQVLNTGGVIGKCTSNNPDFGKPFDVEILGSVLVFPEFGSRSGIPAHVSQGALPAAKNFSEYKPVPIVYIAGTCMNSGKTRVACELVRAIAKTGKKVGGCKLTGVSLQRDLLEMQDFGAAPAASFVDAGIVTTSGECAVQTTKNIFAHLIENGAEIIVAELGDGIMGTYGVQEILSSSDLMARKAALILCAADPVGTWGGKKFLEEKFDLQVDVVSGPVTDNSAGTDFVAKNLGIEAINARLDPEKLGNFIVNFVEK
ncbi:MAG: hypothetical protein KDD66_09295 [Bdellovibrionales bacterium]|nr:hypothetical protein [Bdellovibrionales bacterium]